MPKIKVCAEGLEFNAESETSMIRIIKGECILEPQNIQKKIAQFKSP